MVAQPHSLMLDAAVSMARDSAPGSAEPDRGRVNRLVAKTAGALLIGNELLSGKVQEGNLLLLARMLRSCGVELCRAVTVPDRVELIAKDIRELSSAYDWLFTSGGLGSTHDDVTLSALAIAFGVRLVESSALSDLLGRYRNECGPAGYEQLALIPEGATLEVGGDGCLSAVRFRNIWLLPGIPEVFRAKLPQIEEKLGQAAPFLSRAVHTMFEEHELRCLLEDIVRMFPDIEVGSYPTWGNAAYKTKITFDGRDLGRLEAARDRFIGKLRQPAF